MTATVISGLIEKELTPPTTASYLLSSVPLFPNGWQQQDRRRKLHHCLVHAKEDPDGRATYKKLMMACGFHI
jgi:hypothetical protein